MGKKEWGSPAAPSWLVFEAMGNFENMFGVP